MAESQAQSFAIVEGNKCLPRAFLSWEIGFDSLILRYCDLEKKVLKATIIERNFLYLNVFYKWRKSKGFASRA